MVSSTETGVALGVFGVAGGCPGSRLRLFCMRGFRITWIPCGFSVNRTPVIPYSDSSASARLTASRKASMASGESGAVRKEGVPKCA